MLAFSVVWVVLATAVVVLATFRKANVTVECEDESRIIQQRAATAQHLDTTDRRGKVFGALAVFYGLVLLSGFVYVGWQNSQQILK